MSSVAKLYMKLTGQRQGWIKGESVTQYFEGMIEVDDWRWSVETKNTASSDVKAGEGIKVEPSVFSFGKLMDRSTTPMLAAMQSGESLQAEITVQEMSRDTFELKLTLYDIRVIDYGCNGKVGKADAEVDENWQFNYHRIKFDFKPTARAKGTVAGVLTADATRPPGASLKGPSNPVEELEKLAEKIASNDWPALMLKLGKLRDQAQRVENSGDANQRRSSGPG
jgi:type VI secretion system Hcp family effector